MPLITLAVLSNAQIPAGLYVCHYAIDRVYPLFRRKCVQENHYLPNTFITAEKLLTFSLGRAHIELRADWTYKTVDRLLSHLKTTFQFDCCCCHCHYKKHTALKKGYTFECLYYRFVHFPVRLDVVQNSQFNCTMSIIVSHTHKIEQEHSAAQRR